MNHSQFHAELHSMRHQHLCLVLDLECYSGEPLELDPGARSFQDQLLDNGNDASRPPYHCPIVKPADDDESQYAIGKLMLLDQETSELLSDMIKRHETLSFGCVIDRGLPLEEWQLKKVPIYVNVYCPSDTLEELDSVLQTLGINLEHPFHVPPGIQGPVPVRSGIKLREPKLVRDRRLGQLQYMVIQNLAPSEQFLDLDDRYKKSRDPKNSEFERRNIAQMLENDLEAILAPEFTGAM
ncbi:hypothetical protein FOXG_17261 [Fusarium oxysporum f. sp. lycopersici 4287]|uniref:Uncharacterized protein n=2 Tax=Fusarium oxysporum TaxID=5507 RepID=A0A0J9WBY1_FUSO4|nr:hypothetical protein FOXG_17261 [Fusarium oxysporum f. sp. lycopersici 4287]EWZ78907.1 hypothetical protein FOWG_16912 [Fusarium oxysporum f. sp. lycopersici MN25]KAJ9413712.1 hypothetical protein QL093DRAFT_2594709 [Fusarium oxysporum]KNB20011.1 hypothetical protein FOXG_17261 [Fusarium oxysporum f. sp. lycopersici 4287]